MAQSLQELEREIEERLIELTPKQRRFVEIYGIGDTTQADAAIAAGYGERVATKNATRVFKATKPIIELIRHKTALEQGQPLSGHRAKLMSLFDLCASPGSDTWEPRTAHSISRTLLEIDGFLSKNGSQEREITINIIDPVAAIAQSNQTLAHDDRPAIEHAPGDSVAD